MSDFSLFKNTCQSQVKGDKNKPEAKDLQATLYIRIKVEIFLDNDIIRGAFNSFQTFLYRHLKLV